MGWFRKKEERAEEVTFENALLQALIKRTEITKDKAMQIPTVSGAITLIADIIASTPIKLYKETIVDGDKEAKEEDNDVRVKLLNESTGDTLSANEMWRAVIRDFYLGKGAYIYINRIMNQCKSLHYVDEEYVTILENVDPIFKDYNMSVQGVTYAPHNFIKILRNTKNGGSGLSIVKEHDLILSVAYNSLVFEDCLVRKGGNKKGFLKSENNLKEGAMTDLKEAWKNLYSNNSENVIVLNKGIEFQEASSSSVEMQLNENKSTNSAEIGKIFHMSPSLLNGTSASIKPEEEIQKFVKLAVIPLMKIIESALNEDLLLESEKKSFYFAFDTKELLKGSMKERYETYIAAIKSKVMTIEEARYNEDLKPLGLDFIQLDLGDVLYNPKTKEIFTPNTGQTVKIDNLKGGEMDANRNTQ